MKKCKKCQSDLEDSATKCNKCNANQANWVRRHPVITIVVIAFALYFYNQVFELRKNAQITAGQPTANTASQKTVYKIGDEVKRGDAVLIVKEVNKNWKSQNQFDQPQPGNVYVSILVGIGNNGSKDLSLASGWDFQLKDGQGAKHSQALGGVGLNKLNSTAANSLAPGGTAVGYLLFEVNKTATDKLTLEYQPMLSLGEPVEIELQ